MKMLQWMAFIELVATIKNRGTEDYYCQACECMAERSTATLNL